MASSGAASSAAVECVLVLTQMCVTVPQLTDEWKLFLQTAPHYLLRVLQAVSTVGGVGVGGGGVIVTINNPVSPFDRYLFSPARAFCSCPCIETYCVIYHLRNHLNQFPLCSGRGRMALRIYFPEYMQEGREPVTHI